MDNFQLGYSTAAGDFTGDGIDDIIVGAPRANGLIGQVTIYDDKLNFITNLTDPEGQRGQYFGASLAVVDLNKDGLDDLIIGSPFYTDYTTVLDVKTQEHKPQYDIGKIYVYIQSGAVCFFEKIDLFLWILAHIQSANSNQRPESVESFRLLFGGCRRFER